MRGRAAQGTRSLTSKILQRHVSFAPYQHTTAFFSFSYTLKAGARAEGKVAVNGMYVTVIGLYCIAWSFVLKDICVLVLSSRLLNNASVSRRELSQFLFTVLRCSRLRRGNLQVSVLTFLTSCCTSILCCPAIEVRWG